MYVCVHYECQLNIDVTTEREKQSNDMYMCYGKQLCVFPNIFL